MSDTALPAVSVSELKQQLDQNNNIMLIDVREANEIALCALPGAVHIPLAEIPMRLSEISTDQPIVIYCHHGRRSAQAGQYLQAKGLEVQNLTGGIHAWATEIDPTMPTY